jgi:hypothetical protein
LGTRRVGPRHSIIESRSQRAHSNARTGDWRRHAPETRPRRRRDRNRPDPARETGLEGDSGGLSASAGRAAANAALRRNRPHDSGVGCPVNRLPRGSAPRPRGDRERMSRLPRVPGNAGPAEPPRRRPLPGRQRSQDSQR